MLESIVAMIKGLPAWLAAVAEVLLVTVLFMTAVTFLAGIWCGLRVIGKRANSITKISFFPPKIYFSDEED